jgi:hypothetical protein
MENLKLGEFENNADLLGIDTGDNDLLGKISKLPKEEQSNAIKNLLKSRNGKGGATETSRQEMERQFRQLPKEIREGLLNKRLQLGDNRYYIVKAIASQNNVDIFVGTDQKAIGLGNLATQKLDKDWWFSIFALTMRYAESASGYGVADFTHIPPIVRNGEFEFEAGNKKLVGLMDNSAFDTRDRHDLPIGYYKLDNRKLIEPQVDIKMPVKFTAAAAANSFLRVGLIGTTVMPY